MDELRLKFEKIARDAMDKFHLPSLCVSAWAKGRNYRFSGGLADVERGLPAREDTLYCIGSSTKAFITASLFILSDAGKLELDAPIKAYLPWFRFPDAYWEKHLTVRDAMCHRSGMPRHDLAWLNTPERSSRELVEALGDLPLCCEPRTRMIYQNHMFILLTLLLQQAAGENWTEFVRKNILAPLGMSNTFFYGDEINDESSAKARPYVWTGDKTVRVPFNYMKSMIGAGTVYSTTEDMLKWLRAHLTCSGLSLSPASFAQMHAPQNIIRPGDMSEFSHELIRHTAYGFGWFVEETRGRCIVHHGGSVDGFKSQQLFLPEEDTAISVLTNRNGTQACNAIGYALADLFAGASPIDWNSPYLAEESEIAQVAEKRVREREAALGIAPSAFADPRPLVGSYWHPGYGEIRVSEAGNEAYLHFIGAEFKMKALENGQWIVAEPALGVVILLEFIKEGGKYTRVKADIEDLVPYIPVPEIEFVRRTP